jgi:hypothetical protein
MGVACLVNKMTGGGGFSGIDVSNDNDVEMRLLLTIAKALAIVMIDQAN